LITTKTKCHCTYLFHSLVSKNADIACLLSLFLASFIISSILQSFNSPILQFKITNPAYANINIHKKRTHPPITDQSTCPSIPAPLTSFQPPSIDKQAPSSQAERHTPPSYPHHPHEASRGQQHASQHSPSSYPVSPYNSASP